MLARSGLSASPVLQERVRSDPQVDIGGGVDICYLEAHQPYFEVLER